MASASGNKGSASEVVGEILHGGKKQKATITRVQKTPDDRISQLSDPLLIQILSLLPTEEAYRTSVLSKRWQYLWTSVYNFNFNCINRAAWQVENFGSFVDYVLAHSVSSKIKKFEIHWEYPYHSEISQWLSFAVERKVEDVVLWSDECEELPESFCTCSSLITLGITCFEFRFGTAISWKSLKSIKLEHMELSDDAIVELLAGCPALENMELSEVDCFSRLEINSLNLKRLDLKNLCVDHYERDTSMEIFAPYLQHFGISGDLEDVKFRLLDVSSLVNANLTFTNNCLNIGLNGEDCQNDHQGFINLVLENLQKLNCATELTLGSWFTEALCMLQLKGVLIPELKCKYLMLELHIETFNLYGAAGILRPLRHAETLNIDMSNPIDRSRCNFEVRCLAEGDNIDLQSCISSFEFPNLKNVKIVSSFGGVCSGDHFDQGFEKLFKFSEFVLKNAKTLEKFVISTRKKCKICSSNCMFTYLSLLSTKLYSCPRASTNCAIILK